ncbi:MAG: DUF4351 domain-containing protein [Planctomycetaceae bacterium]|nr:DUF4351 domain-containing protein [Planctomycetaceae bacterium]
MQRTLTKRFNTVPAAMTADVNALSDVAEIEKLADLAFDCKTLDEFGKAMK